VIDSEAHAWVRIPRNWRHWLSAVERHTAPLTPLAAANFRARPRPDGSFTPAEETSQELLACMDRHGVDISVIYPGPCLVPNDEIARVVATAPDRFIGFAKHGIFVPPFAARRNEQAAADELEHGLRDLGLRGVAELSCNEWKPEPPETAIRQMYPVFELCARYDVPAVVHAHGASANEDLRYVSPKTFEPLARDFPSVPLVLNHMGGVRRELFDAALEMAALYDNVYFNTSMSTSEFLTEAVRKVGADRIVFGVDWYALDEPETEDANQHRKQMSVVERAEMTDHERELVMGESLAKLLKLAPV
jgi:predicted TIM-barrel fold metal-dependent hydrolase